jgi:hypothetical protein
MHHTDVSLTLLQKGTKKDRSLELLRKKNDIYCTCQEHTVANLPHEDIYKTASRLIPSCH